MSTRTDRAGRRTATGRARGQRPNGPRSGNMVLCAAKGMADLENPLPTGLSRQTQPTLSRQRVTTATVPAAIKLYATIRPTICFRPMLFESLSLKRPEGWLIPPS
jgi:hypothetical protein